MTSLANPVLFLATANAERSRAFYERVLGLTFVADEPPALVFRVGETMLRIQKVERVHAALNETAGEVLFEPGLDRFVALRPRFAPLRDELARFFADSRTEFFAGGDDAVDARWLVALCRRCRDLERGAA